MSLLLLRHAKSDWTTGQPDHERPLNKRGRRDATRLGEWFISQQLARPEKIVCSTATRARQTLQRFNQSAQIPEEWIEFSSRLYHAGLENLLTIISKNPAPGGLMLIGHNPGFDELLQHLCNQSLPKTDSGKLMTTASLAVLDLNHSEDSSSPGNAELIQLIRPKEITLS